MMISTKDWAEMIADTWGHDTYRRTHGMETSTELLERFKSEVLKEAAERGRVYISEFNDEVSRFGEMRVTEQDLVSAILGEHAPEQKTFMGLPVFDSQPAGPMLGLEPKVQDAVQNNFRSLTCPACAESVDGKPGNGACQQCREESDRYNDDALAALDRLEGRNE